MASPPPPLEMELPDVRKAGSSSQSGSGNGGSGTAAAGGVGAGAGAGSGGNNARDVEGGRSGRLGLTSMEFPKSHRKAGHGHKLHVLKSGPKQLGEAGGVGVEVYFRDTCAMGILFIVMGLISIPVLFLQHEAGERIRNDGLTFFEDMRRTFTAETSFRNATARREAHPGGIQENVWLQLVDVIVVCMVLLYLLLVPWYTAFRAHLGDLSRLTSSDFGVFVQNLPTDITEDELHTYFSRWGSVVSVTLVKGIHAYRNHVQKLTKLRGLRREMRDSERKTMDRIERELEAAKSNPKLMQCSGRAFVVFDEEDDATTCRRDLNPPLRRVAWSLLCHRCKWPRVPAFRDGHIMHVSRAPEPDNLVWPDLTHTTSKRAGRVMLTVCVMTLLLVLSFALVTYLTVVQISDTSKLPASSSASDFHPNKAPPPTPTAPAPPANATGPPRNGTNGTMAGTNFTQPPPAGPGLEPRDEVDQQLLELVPGVAIVIINSFINQAAKFLARAQRLSTREATQHSRFTMTVIAQTLNSVLVLWVVHWSSATTWWEPEGFANAAMQLLLANAVLPPLIALFFAIQPLLLLWLVKLCCFCRACARVRKVAEDRHRHGAVVSLAYWYSVLVKSFALALAFGHIVPGGYALTMIGLLLHYWQSKISFVHFVRRMPNFGIAMSTTAHKFMSVIVLVHWVGVWRVIEGVQATWLRWGLAVEVVLWVIYLLVPFKILANQYCRRGKRMNNFLNQSIRNLSGPVASRRFSNIERLARYVCDVDDPVLSYCKEYKVKVHKRRSLAETAAMPKEPQLPRTSTFVVTKVKGASQFAYSTEVSGMLPCLACCCQRRCCRPKARDVGPNDSAASMGSRNGNGASNKAGAGAGSGATGSVASGSKSDVLGSLRDVTAVVEEEGEDIEE